MCQQNDSEILERRLKAAEAALSFYADERIYRASRGPGAPESFEPAIMRDYGRVATYYFDGWRFGDTTTPSDPIKKEK